MSAGGESLFCCPACGKRLERGEKQYRCPAGHSYDTAREGYVNLLLVSRRHSSAPGDDREMAAARARFLEGGWYAPLRSALCALVEKYAPASPVLLDAGCGEGWYTQALAQAVSARGGRTAGVDLSKPSVKRAARRPMDAELAVGTVYHLPVSGASVDVLVDCFSPLAAEEFLRVLRPGGSFLYVVPGPRHLWELKEILYDRPYENRERREEYLGFRYREVLPVEDSFTLTDRQAILDLFHMTPYYWKTPRSGVERLEALDRLTVSAQFRVHVLERIAPVL